MPTIAAPTYENWLDAPQTPGDWRYTAEQGETLALFGATGSSTDFVIACRPASRQVALVRAGSADGPVPMRIRTETADRVVEAVPANSGPARLIVTFAATDPLLDAIAFSRGRFAVETAGMPAMFIPAWPEITRVIEDCR